MHNNRSQLSPHKHPREKGIVKSEVSFITQTALQPDEKELQKTPEYTVTYKPFRNRYILQDKRCSVPLPIISRIMHNSEQLEQSQVKRQRTEISPVLEECSFETIVEELRNNRSAESLGKLAQYLSFGVNPFNRLKPSTILLMLAECRLKQFSACQLIYRKGEPSRTIMFVVSGKVRLSNKANFFQKICRRGDTLGQQTLFPTSRYMSSVIRLDTKVLPRLETARALSNSFLLEMPASKMESIYLDLIRSELREEYHLLGSLMWRSFTTKTSLRREVCLK